MANVSAQRLKQIFAALPKTAQDAAASELEAQANALADLMRRVAPVRSGNLRQSIRVERNINKHALSFSIKAGGPLTTVDARQHGFVTAFRAARAGKAIKFDYSRAIEFGRVGAAAHPFFFSSYRLAKKKIRSSVQKKITRELKRSFNGG
jgi:hypothetical protein